MSNQIVFKELTEKELYTANRPEVIEMFVEAGKQIFNAELNYKITEKNIYNWLFLESQLYNIKISAYELPRIIEIIYAHGTNVYYDGYQELTVGDLKRKIANLPDNTPVLYQRIEDKFFDSMSWKQHKFVWESSIAKEKEIEWVKANPSKDNEYNLYEKDGKTYLRYMSNYIRAFSACSQKNDDGKVAFLINAHY